MNLLTSISQKSDAQLLMIIKHDRTSMKVKCKLEVVLSLFAFRTHIVCACGYVCQADTVNSK